jgi:hypothetical protein
MADLALEPPVASAEPATRQALRRAGRIRSAAVGFGVVAVLFALLFWWAGGSSGRELAANGQPVDGTVTIVAAQRVNGGGTERGRVTFTFVADGGQQTASNEVGGTIQNYSVGQPVEVIVPPGNPAGARLSGELDRPGWEVPAVLLGGAGLAAGAWGLVRARALRRMTRALDAEPWLAVHSALNQASVGGLGGARSMGVVALAREPGDTAVVVTNRGLRRLGVDVEPLAWVTGWGSRELVLSPPGGGRPLEVRPVAMARPDRATGGTKR